MEVYIHLPFCVKKCAYCDFLSGPQSEEVIEQYVYALEREIRACHMDREVTTVFLGGGTPSVLTGKQISRIFDVLHETFRFADEAEITIEANPGTVTEEKLLAYRRCGVNRISFGLQSTDAEELKLLGRIHTFEEFLESYHLARKFGFHNINIDLMSAIPKQTLTSWEQTLERVVRLEPEHISAYSLIIEEGTPFYERYGEGSLGEKELPGEDEEREIYYRTKERLREAGYERYEISNYARRGYECRHNLGYWERKEYLGFGLGAASLVGEVRCRNTEHLQEYLKYAGSPEKIREDVQKLSVQEQMEEFLFLGLRKTEGVSEKEFLDSYGTSMEQCYGRELRKLTEEGLLQKNDGRIRLTERGVDVSNYVFSAFIK